MTASTVARKPSGSASISDYESPGNWTRHLLTKVPGLREFPGGVQAPAGLRTLECLDPM
jgi:hypothetical protein